MNMFDLTAKLLDSQPCVYCNIVNSIPVTCHHHHARLLTPSSGARLQCTDVELLSVSRISEVNQ
jgi:hypothetical protein